METLITNKTVERLKYDLVRENIISFEYLQEAEQEAEKHNKTLAHSLIDLKILSEKALLEFIETKLRIPFVHLDDYSLDTKCLNFINKQDALRLRILPLFKIEEVLTVAMADPLDLFSVNTVLGDADFKVEPVVCSESSILRAINKNYSESCSLDDVNVDLNSWRSKLESDCFDAESAELFFNDFIAYAISKKYYDISIKEDKNKLSFVFQDAKDNKKEDSIPLLVAPLLYSVFKSKSEVIYKESHSFFSGGFNTIVACNEYFVYVSKINHINGKQTVLKIYPLTLKTETDELNIKKVGSLFGKSGIIAICSKNDIIRSSFVYLTLLNADLKDKEVFTAEQFIKKPIETVCQNKLDLLPGASLQTIYVMAKFHSADVIWVEGSLSFDFLNYLTVLVGDGKTIIAEFNCDNKQELIQSFEQNDCSYMKNYILDFVEL
ncbi:MAG: hypothetical protein WCK67_06495 [bacterium]